MIILLVLSLSLFITACQSSYSGGITYRGICSTDTLEAMCVWRSLSGEYYCEQTVECANYCTYICYTSGGYQKLISASGITQEDKLNLTRVYCTCVCEKCV